MRGKVMALGLLAVSASVLSAQGGGRGGRRMQPGMNPPPAGDSMKPNRAMLEQRVQQRLGQMMKQQLGLNDAQMKKVQETNRKFEQKRRVLVDQERDIRMSLRDEMARPDSARQGQVGGLLDRMTKVQRQRLDILDEEQKELGTVLTPLQRAKYLGLEERVRQRMQQMRQQQMQRGGKAMGRGRMMGPGGGSPPDGNPVPPATQRVRRRPPISPPSA